MGKREDFALEKRTLPLAQQALGLCFMLRATEHQDLKEATDIVLLRVGVSNVAFRMRRPRTESQWRCGPDVTFRLSRPSGVKTEWQKVVTEGAADFMFYAILASEQPDVLGRFVILNLGEMRAQWNSGFGLDGVVDQRNRDGTQFRAIKTSFLSPASIHSAFNWPLTAEQCRRAHLPRPAGDWCVPWSPPMLLESHEIWLAHQMRLWA